MADKRNALRWMFRIIGLLLSLLTPAIFMRRLFPVHQLATWLYPSEPRRQIAVLGVIILIEIAIGALCFLTAWGFKHHRRWARWTGVVASAGLVPLFPWLTPFGFIGLYLLILSPPVIDEKPTDDLSRLRPRDSPLQWVASVLVFGLWIAGCGYLRLYARTLGLPAQARDLGHGFWFILVAGEFVVVSIHEFGHALAAWAVGFRFKSLCIGPIVTWKDAVGPRHFRFEWKRLLRGGGYMGSVPTSEHNLRLNQILVIIAGPVASLIAGLVLFLVFLLIPGSGFEQHWRIAGYGSLLFVADFIRNLIPLGYCDGALLLHLTLWTRKGREFSSAWFSSTHYEKADQFHASADFENEAGLRRHAVDQAIEHGQKPSVELAHQYLNLGFSQLRAIQLQEAEQNLLRSREMLKQCRANPVLEANVWLGLHRVYRLQHRSGDSVEAARAAILAFAKLKDKLSKDSLIEVQAALAQLHIDLDEDYAALREVDQALSNFPAGRDHLIKKAGLLRLKANCEFRIGSPESALAAIQAAVDVLCSDQIQDSDRARAASDLAASAITVWNTGRNEQAVAILSDSVRRLEENGAVERAVRLRIVLSEILRKAGRLVEAESALPSGDGLSPANRESLLTSRGQIQLLSGRVPEAIVNFEQALQLKKEDVQAPPTEVATAENLLGDALLDAGRIEDAEVFAQRALDILKAAVHPNAAGAMLTLALIGRLRNTGSPDSSADEAMHLIVNAPMVETAAKARFLESEAARLERFGCAAEATRFRASAASLWERVAAPQEALSAHN